MLPVHLIHLSRVESIPCSSSPAVGDAFVYPLYELNIEMEQNNEIGSEMRRVLPYQQVSCEPYLLVVWKYIFTLDLTMLSLGHPGPLKTPFLLLFHYFGMLPMSRAHHETNIVRRLIL